MKNKVPAVLAGIYAALVAVSIVPIFTGDDALSGIFAVVLGVPWTQLMSLALDAIDPTLFDTATVGIVLAVIGGAINAAIIFLVSRWIVQRKQGRRQSTGS